MARRTLPPNPAPSPARATAAQIAVDLALSELNAELAGADNDEVKAFSLLAVDLAVVALVVTIRDVLDRYWYWMVVGLVASAAVLVLSLWRRLYDTGPNALRFFEDTADALDAEHVALIALLSLASAHDNNKLVRLHKGRLYTASLVIFIVTAVAGTAFLVGVH